MANMSVESLPVLVSTNGSSWEKRVQWEDSEQENVTRGKVKSVKGTNFIRRNIQLVCKKKEDEFTSLFLTELENKRLEEILGDDKKEGHKRNSKLSDALNIGINPYRLSKQNELSVREIDLKLQPVSPAAENVIQRLIENCQSSSIHNKERRAQLALPKRPASSEPSTKQLRGIISPKHFIPPDVIHLLLMDTQISMPSFQYRFPS